MLPSTKKSAFKTDAQKKSKVTEAQEIKDKIDIAYFLSQVVTNKPAKERNVYSIYGDLVAAKLKEMKEHPSEVSMHRIDTKIMR